MLRTKLLVNQTENHKTSAGDSTGLLLIRHFVACSGSKDGGPKVPQTVRYLHCQILYSRNTGCFFLYHTSVYFDRACF
jgi:hypothetical protein